MAEQAIDITGDACPLTLVRVKLALEQLTPGDTLTVRLAGEEPVRNLPSALREEGFEVSAPTADGPAHRLTVRIPQP